MSRGFQGVHGQGVESRLAPLTTGGSKPARGLSLSQPAVPQPEHATRGVNVMSPAERFQRAVEAGEMTAEERAAFHSAVARIAAQDDLRRAEPSPQLELVA